MGLSTWISWVFLWKSVADNPWLEISEKSVSSSGLALDSPGPATSHDTMEDS